MSWKNDLLDRLTPHLTISREEAQKVVDDVASSYVVETFDSEDVENLADELDIFMSGEDIRDFMLWARFADRDYNWRGLENLLERWQKGREEVKDGQLRVAEKESS
jgi:hypothetical protein